MSTSTPNFESAATSWSLAWAATRFLTVTW